MVEADRAQENRDLDLAKVQRSVLMISNTAAIVEVMGRKFDIMTKCECAYV